MAKCPYCDTEVQEGVKYCTNCGASLENVEPAPVQPSFEAPAQQAASGQPYQQPQTAQSAPAQAAPVDSGSIGWAILGFIIPLAGIILFLVWRTSRPQTAKMACIGAAAGFIVGLIINMLTQANF